MLSILLFIERRNLEIRRPVLNFEITDSSIVPFLKVLLMLNSLNLILQNSKLVLESLTFNFSFRKPITLRKQTFAITPFQSIG